MGKVLSDFLPGWPGTVSRSIDDIIVALPNAESSTSLQPGTAVTLSDDGKGVKYWRSAKTADDFLGIIVRSPSRTPAAYGANTAAVAPGEMAEVITRGSVIVTLEDGVPDPGDPVYIVKSTGGFATDADSGSNLKLNGVHFRGVADADGNIEIVLNERNVL